MRVMARVLFSIAVLTIATPAWARGDRIDDRSLSAEILNPKMAVIYYYRATVHYYMDRYDDAIADYELAIRLRRNYADAYFNRGLAYSRKGLLRRRLAICARRSPSMRFHFPPANGRKKHAARLPKSKQRSSRLKTFRRKASTLPEPTSL